MKLPQLESLDKIIAIFIDGYSVNYKDVFGNTIFHKNIFLLEY